MQSRKGVSLLTLMLTLTFLAACGDDDDGGATGPDDSGDITREESVEMLDALAVAGTFSPPAFGGAQARVQAAAAAIPLDQSVTGSAPCPEGGTIQLSGSLTGEVDDQTGAADLNFDITQTHSDCGASSSSGTSFVFNGAPSIQTDMSIVTDPDQSFSMTGTQTGGLAWETGGKSGSCAFDLSYDFSGSANDFAGTVSGTVCGFDVTESVSF